LEHVTAWRAAMRAERLHHVYSWRDLATYLGWVLALGPAIAFTAASTLARFRAALSIANPLTAIVVPASVQLAGLALYQDIAYSPRYLLPALAGAVAIPGSLGFEKWISSETSRSVRRTWVSVALLVLPIAVAAPAVSRLQRPLRMLIEGMPARLATLPRDAIVVTGQPCPSIMMYRSVAFSALRARPAIQAVCPGWSWPDDLDAYLERLRLRSDSSARVVVIDLRARAWIGRGQQAALSIARAYIARHPSRIDDGTLRVWRD
jgi:hypothetical protein